MNLLLQDIRLAYRRLRAQPGFTAVAVLTLALGLGANIAVFTLVHALILRSLPVERPAELYRLGDGNDCCVNSGLAGSYSLFSTRLFEHLKVNTPELSTLAAFQATTVSMGVRRPGAPAGTAMPGVFVSGNYFSMFGVRPAAGRLLRAEDDTPGAPPVAVMAYWAWTQHFGRDPSVVGGAFSLNGTPMTIVGVSAPTFFGDSVRPDPAALWIPIAQEKGIRGAASVSERADQNWLYAIGRLAPDVRPERVGARATAALQQWLSGQPFVTDDERPHLPRQRIVVSPAGGGVGTARQQYARSLNLLFGASALVLLIGAANLANLLLARADRGQAAIRAALGASSGQLIRQSLTEGVVLALAGAAAGIIVAIVSTQALLRIVFPLATFVPIDTTPPLAVWLFALLLAIVTGALFAAAPAWAMARTAPLDALAGTGRNASARSFVPRGALVVVQVTLSLVLLSTAGLLATSLGNLEQQPLGFTPANRLVVRIDPPPIAGEIDRLSNLYARLDEQLRRVQGIERVAASMYSPMEDNNWSFRVSVAGRRADPDRADFTSWNRVTADYFSTVGTRVLRGRALDARDTPGSRRVAVVNQSFVGRYFEGRDPLGQTVGLGDAAHASDYEIVGIVEDAKYTGATRREVRPMLFLSAFQAARYTSDTMQAVQARSMLLRALVVQVSPSAGSLEGRIRQAIAAADPNVTVIRVLTMPAQVSANFRIERLMSRLSTVYGALALALASLGLYGVTAYGVARRTREIGVRMALGADRRRVVWLCARRPLLQAAVGLAIGLPAALAVGRVIGAQLYDVGGLDPTVFLAAVVALGLSTLLAAALPARRAASVNPSVALRGE
jgi:predicted permease